MNDETENIPGESSEPAPQESETETSPVNDGSVTDETYEIPETMADMATEETFLEVLPESTEETVSLTVQETIISVGSDIVHADLFGSFLVCGTLIGIALWRKIHGS